MADLNRFPVCLTCLGRCRVTSGEPPSDLSDRRCCVCGHTVPGSASRLTDGATADKAHAVLHDALESGAFL